jgi:hypothetical protein
MQSPVELVHRVRPRVAAKEIATHGLRRQGRAGGEPGKAFRRKGFWQGSVSGSGVFAPGRIGRGSDEMADSEAEPPSIGPQGSLPSLRRRGPAMRGADFPSEPANFCGRP